MEHSSILKPEGPWSLLAFVEHQLEYLSCLEKLMHKVKSVQHFHMMLRFLVHLYQIMLPENLFMMVECFTIMQDTQETQEKF